VIAIVRELPEARAVPHGTHLSLKVRKRRFGWFLCDHHGDGRVAVNFKSSTPGLESLSNAHSHHFQVPKYLAHRAWAGLWLDLPDVPWSAVRAALADAWRMTAPKTLVARLEARAHS
jgi:predicted DNA-binding protein (MmcQ/YjbR family)